MIISRLIYIFQQIHLGCFGYVFPRRSIVYLGFSRSVKTCSGSSLRKQYAL